MKKRLFFLVMAFSAAISVDGQSIDACFGKLRNNSAELTAFFARMPKGGDLHNHFSGAVYAETYVSYVVAQDYCINTTTLEVKTRKPANAGDEWARFSELAKNNMLPLYKDKLMEKWSVKDYNGVSYPSDKQFFETFAAFGIANESQARLDTGILELKKRAETEHVSYIETMFTGSKCDLLKEKDAENNQSLEAAQRTRDAEGTFAILERMYTSLKEKNVGALADAYNDTLARMHAVLHIDDSLFTMRYMNYVSRLNAPAVLFQSLVLAFESAEKSNLVVGVNIVAPENAETSMHDYWLHMQMFRFCHARYPGVRYSMHAGELAPGMVQPEEMGWHINEAVRVAGASRIGHGVDLPFEKDPYALLTYMADHKIAVEINLYSNEFILKVKGDEHPFKMYKDFKVPIVISSDDPGVLRSSMTLQFVQLAREYPFVSYRDIKQYVYNSIDYSFIKDDATKRRLRSKLDEDFNRFEHEVINAYAHR